MDTGNEVNFSDDKSNHSADDELEFLDMLPLFNDNQPNDVDAVNVEEEERMLQMRKCILILPTCGSILPTEKR